MAFENLFIRKQKSIGSVKLDAVLTETHDNRFRLTKNPVELGADITDNAFIEPKTVTISAVVTDTPIGIAAIGEIIDNVTGLFGTSSDENITRSSAAYNSVIALAGTREPLELQTNLKLYENMVITGVNTSQNKDTSRAVNMIIKLEEVLIVETQTVQLTADQLAAGSPKEQATSPEKKGRQQVTTPADGTQTSVLKSAKDFIFGG
jgi:hypothetical protein